MLGQSRGANLSQCQNRRMHEAGQWRIPALVSAMAISCALLLQGCGSLWPARTGASADDAAQTGASGKRDAFSVRVQAPDAVREHLETHLSIQRYRTLDDLALDEISRLMVAAEADAREQMATLGYFTPTITLELRDTPDDKKAPHEVLIEVEPGPPTHIDKVQIDFTGAITQDSQSPRRERALRGRWKLPSGQIFTQEGWDDAKSALLHSLAARRYPTASLAASRADVDADTQKASLSATYDSGPAYRFGLLDVRGAERYDADGVRRIARLPTGSDYDQQQLLDAQQRLASSGYYDSAFLMLDTSDGVDPQFAPVIAHLREAPLQKLVAGIGFTSDNGVRLSLDHIYNRLPLLGWRAVSRLSYDKNNKLLGSEWSALPDDNGWRWFSSGQMQRQENAGSYTINSVRARFGRNKASNRIDRSLFLQYDYANNRGIDPPPSASALTLNWGWTGRYFDNVTMPARGWGLALELGTGYTLIGERLPYTRTYARWLNILPLGGADGPRSAARRSRFALRLEGGAIVAKNSAQIPTTQMFLTGGDTTVRGYSYRQIGVTNAAGLIEAGRYLEVASLEYQYPIVRDGKLTDLEGAAFVDAGAVSDKVNSLRPKVGVGVGVRWRSPFGPVQADLAYGVDVKKLRLHLRVGFNF